MSGIFSLHDTKPQISKILATTIVKGEVKRYVVWRDQYERKYNFKDGHYVLSWYDMNDPRKTSLDECLDTIYEHMFEIFCGYIMLLFLWRTSKLLYVRCAKSLNKSFDTVENTSTQCDHQHKLSNIDIVPRTVLVKQSKQLRNGEHILPPILKHILTVK